MKQIERVLEAVRNGAETSHDCSLDTGLSVKHCSNWLKVLEYDGRVICTGTFYRAIERRCFVGHWGVSTFKYRKWRIAA